MAMTTLETIALCFLVLLLTAVIVVVTLNKEE